MTNNKSILDIRSVQWDDAEGILRMIDQRKLPLVFEVVECRSVQDIATHITKMTVRGAPAIGAAGAFGMAIAARASSSTDGHHLLNDLRTAKRALDDARPTAVNLSWATERIYEAVTTALERGDNIRALREVALAHAKSLAEEDVDINRRLSIHGAELVKEGANVLHHCNTGALATVDIGTALGVIYESHKQGKNIHVWVDETRPRLQGATLTAWELMRAKVPMHLIVDNAAGHLMRTGKVDIILFGADRVAVNGDVANKIGTYKVAVVGRENGIPVYACVPTSTIDLNCASGDDIPIEERSAEEVTTIGGQRVAPEGCLVFNPGFDVTPSKYLTGIITEEGVCYPPYEISLPKAVRAAKLRRSPKE